MKKKKQNQITPAAEFAGNLEAVIHSHSEFFDHLIELIPARFYVPADDADSKPWYQGLSKAAKASLKQQSKENLKLARRNRFDPDVEPSSAVKLHTDKAPAEPVDEEDNKEKSVTYEELREKLRRKIEALRGNRGESKRYEKRAENEGNKRKRDGGNEGAESGNVRLGNEDDGKISLEKKKRKLSKAKELEIAKKKQEAKRENPTVAERESWKAAASRAMGVKVHDDARLIKESMRKEKRRKEKNAEKWKERVGSQEKMKDERQKKRRENISGRINDKKMKKIAKREKKLMRPGFEGRKEGFITKE
ncbi:hypothetical protein C2S51_035452 [Perilla frutescens var. frutescens]|nr:hypothetical protein C2S51_035452 [Perilla frutescens var. frutescens]